MKLFTTSSLDPWFADDKAAHLGLGALYWLVLRHLPFPLSVWLLLGGVVGWELLELVRYAWLPGTGYKSKVADLVSWKDMALGIAGALLAQLLA